MENRQSRIAQCSPALPTLRLNWQESKVVNCNSHALDEALAEWAEAHGDQTKENHASLLDAIRYCKVAADVSEGDTD